MRNLFSLKLMLAVLCMSVGINVAWADDQTIVSYTFDNAESPAITLDGSNGDRGTANYDFDSPISTGKFMNVWGENNSNGFKVATIATEDITSNGQWTLEFDWAGYSGCNKKAGQTKLVDLEGNTFFSIDDAADWGNTFTLSTGGTVACYPCNKATRISANTGSVLSIEYWHHFTVIGTQNGVSVTIEQYGTDGKKTAIVENARVTTTNVTPASIGLRPGSCGSVAIDNLTLTVGELKVTEFAYTVKFVTEDGTEFKEPSTRIDVAGAILSITDDDKATITDGNTQYIYKSDDANEQALEGEGQIITITYQKLTVTNYTVNYVDAAGNTLKGATTHANVKVGTEVTATVGELAQILIENTLYNYVSGAEPLTIGEDEAQNVINLVFAPVEGIEAYYLQNYEAATDPDWTTATSGRYTPVLVDGSKIASREQEVSHTEQQPKVDPETGDPVLDPETGEQVMEDVKIIDGTKTIDFANKSYFLSVAQDARNNNGVSNGVSSGNLAVDKANFTFESKILLGTSNNQGCSFKIKNFAGDQDILTLIPTAVGSTTWVVNGDAENFAIALPGTPTTTGTTNDNLNNLSWYNLKVTVYNGYTFVTITDEEGTAILEQAAVPTLATSYGIGKMFFYTGRYNSNIAIDDVLVRSVMPNEDVPSDYQFVAVNINYVDAEGNTLKTAETVNFNAGATIELNSAFTADFKVDAEGAVWTAESETAPVTKYIYVSDNSAETVAAEGASVNIVYRGVASRRIALRPQIQLADGTMSTKDASGANIPFFYDSNKAGDVLFEGDVLTYYYPYYLLVDGLLYKTGANSGNEDHGTLEIEAGTGTQIKSPVTWVAATKSVQSVDEEGKPMFDEEENPVMEDVQISDVVYVQESENIEGMTVVKDAYTTIRMANGAAGSAIGGNVLVTTLEPGVYTITSATRSGTTNFLVNGEVVFTIASTGTVQTATSAEITLDKETPIYIEEQAAITQYSDYVMITKVGDVAGPVVEINNLALSVDQVFNEDNEIVAAFTYEVVINDTELAEQYYVLSPTVYYTVYDGENEVYSKSCDFDISGDARNLFLTDLEPNKEYKVVINKIVVEDYSNVDWETVFDAEIVLEEEGELATATFTTEEPLPTELANADFSASTPTAVGVHTYEKDIVKDEEGNALDVAQAQEVEGWTIVENGDARAAAVYAYGSEAYLGGEGFNAPATNPEGAAEGNALGLVAVWTGKIQYTQKIQLPAGEYMLEVPVYNAGGANAFATNLIGVNDTYATTTKYAVGQWTTEQVKFTLEEEGPVTVSVGYAAADAGSAAMPHLFIDQVKILGEAEIAAAELAAAKANALAEIDALPQGDGLFCYGWSADLGYAAYYYEAQEAIEAAEDIDAVEAAVAAYKATQALPDPEAEYMLQSKQNDYYLTLSEAGVQIAEKPTAVKFEAAEDGKYYIKAGEFYVGLAGTDNWSMSADPEKKAALTITLTDGYYTLAQEKGLVGVDYPKKENFGCWADKKASDGDAVLWSISEYGVLDIDLASMAVEVGTEFDEDDMLDVKIAYTVNEVAGAFADVQPVFIATLYKGEEEVKEFEFTTYTDPIEGTVADGGVKGGISGIEYDTAYTLVLTKVQFWNGFTADWAYNYVYSKDVEVKTAFVIQNPATAITSLSTADAEIEAVYTIGGAQLQGLQKGMNIVKYANGSVKKVFVK